MDDDSGPGVIESSTAGHDNHRREEVEDERPQYMLELRQRMASFAVLVFHMMRVALLISLYISTQTIPYISTDPKKHHPLAIIL